MATTVLMLLLVYLTSFKRKQIKWHFKKAKMQQIRFKRHPIKFLKKVYQKCLTFDLK